MMEKLVQRHQSRCVEVKNVPLTNLIKFSQRFSKKPSGMIVKSTNDRPLVPT